MDLGYALAPLFRGVCPEDTPMQPSLPLASLVAFPIVSALSLLGKALLAATGAEPPPLAPHSNLTPSLN